MVSQDEGLGRLLPAVDYDRVVGFGQSAGAQARATAVG
jgi:hypothetical protein